MFRNFNFSGRDTVRFLVNSSNIFWKFKFQGHELHRFFILDEFSINWSSFCPENWPITVAPYFDHFWPKEFWARRSGWVLTRFPWFTRVCWSVWFCLSATGPYPSEKNVTNKRFSFGSHWNTHLPFWSTFSTRVHLKSHFRKMCTRQGLIKDPLKGPQRTSRVRKFLVIKGLWVGCMIHRVSREFF